MDALQQWGLNLILALQQFSPALDGLMQFLSYLGREDFFFLLVPFVYWCVDAVLGMRLLAVLIFSDFTNGMFKWAFHAPRPYWIDAQVKALSAETSYGIPSGHAQDAAAIWGFVAGAIKKSWAWVAAAVLILGISISRLYLGVHFPHDVVGGWIIGAAALGVYLWAEPRVVGWLESQPLGAQIGAAFALSLALIAVVLGARAALALAPDPPEWKAQAAAAYPPEPGEKAVDPRNTEGFFTELGALFGAGAGFALQRRYAPFDARGPWWKRIARFALGLAVLLGLRFGLGAVFPDEPLVLGLALRYVRYTILLLWATLGAPWVFVKVRLAEIGSQD